MTLRNVFGDLESADDSQQVSHLLRAIIDRLGFIDPANGGMRVSLSLNNGGTISTITTVGNLSSSGGYPTNNDQQAQFYLAASQNRNRITVV
jgi:hypothetical protein